MTASAAVLKAVPPVVRRQPELPSIEEHQKDLPGLQNRLAGVPETHWLDWQRGVIGAFMVVSLPLLSLLGLWTIVTKPGVEPKTFWMVFMIPIVVLIWMKIVTGPSMARHKKFNRASRSRDRELADAYFPAVCSMQYRCLNNTAQPTGKLELALVIHILVPLTMGENGGFVYLTWVERVLSDLECAKYGGMEKALLRNRAQFTQIGYHYPDMNLKRNQNAYPIIHYGPDVSLEMQ